MSNDPGCWGVADWTYRMMRTLAAAFAMAVVMGVPSWAASPYDGVYRGGNTLNGGGGTRCQPAQSFNIAVRDGEFIWVIGNERTPVRVGADGRFNGQSGARFITGRIEGQTMTASTSGTACNYTWSLSK